MFFQRRKYSLAMYADSEALSFLLLSKRREKITLEKKSVNDSQHCFPTRKVYATLPDFKVLKKQIKFDSVLKKRDILFELQSNQAQYFPGISTPLLFDVHFIGEQHQVFAIRESDLKERQRMLEIHRLKLVSLEPESYSLLKIILYYKKELKKEGHYAALFLFKNTRQLILFNHQLIVEVVDIAHLDQLPSLEKSLEKCFIISLDSIADDFCGRLSSEIKSKVEVIDIFSQFDISSLDQIDQSTVATFGAALKGFYA